MSLNGVDWQSFWQAVRQLRRVRQARRQERAAAVRSDREVAAIFTGLAKREWVSVMRNVKDYAEYLELRRELETNST